MRTHRNSNTELRSWHQKLHLSVVPSGNIEQTCFYANIWTLYGHWGSGPSAPDGEIPNQSNLWRGGGGGGGGGGGP